MNYFTTDIKPVASPVALADRKALTRAVDIALNAVARSSKKPILQNLKLEGCREYLNITGTDLDIELSVRIPVAADCRLNSTIPARKFRDFLKKAPASEYVLLDQSSDSEFTLDFEKVKYNLKSIPGVDYPKFEWDQFEWDESEKACFELSGSWLAETIGAIKPAIATEDRRDVLKGLFMHFMDGRLHLVATDGHRLFKRSIDAPPGCETMPPVIVPHKAITVLYKLIEGKKGPENVLIDVTALACSFEFDDVTLKTKNITGTYPDYCKVIPADFKTVIGSDSADFMEKIKGVALVSGEKWRSIKLSFFDDQLDISVNSPEMGSATATVRCNLDGENLTIGFNSQYLEKVIDGICPDGGEFRAEFLDPGSPGKFTGTLSDFVAVLMPVRFPN